VRKDGLQMYPKKVRRLKKDVLVVVGMILQPGVMRSIKN
jgi:hypothetical protein